MPDLMTKSATFSPSLEGCYYNLQKYFTVLYTVLCCKAYLPFSYMAHFDFSISIHVYISESLNLWLPFANYLADKPVPLYVVTWFTNSSAPETTWYAHTPHKSLASYQYRTWCTRIQWHQSLVPDTPEHGDTHCVQDVLDQVLAYWNS